ncbi:MAG TPA: HD domain-containing phosphohydrolase [bacterium]|nr:HD domain-containing phosphohydrolase [bacterium]
MNESVETPTEIKISRPDADDARRAASLQAAKLLLGQIAAIQKLLKMYDPENATVLQAGDAFLATLKELFIDQPIAELKFWRDCIFVNCERLRCDVSNFASYKYVLGQAQRLEIEKIAFRAGISRDQAIRFYRFLESAEAAGAKGGEVVEKMAAENLSHVSLTSAIHVERELDTVGLKSLSKPERAKRAFFAALGSAKELLTSQTSQGAASMRKAKRAVQAAVDILLEDESSLLALAAIKDHDEYTFSHSVNVCIFSLATGHCLGLDRSQLSKLGIAALFHDIGKTSVPQDVLNKIGLLDVNEWKAIREHTVMGVRRLSRMPRCNEHILHSLVVAFQHHLNLDQSGYPLVPPYGSLDVFSRIVRIADTFDAMTTERPYRNKVYSPYEAIRYLVSQAGTKFDPILVKAFARAIGVFPIGTVLRLATGEVGIVVRRSNLSGDPNRPTMRVLLDSKGTPVAESRLIDLGQTDPGTGQFSYTVVETLSCKDLGVNPRDYLMP